VYGRCAKALELMQGAGGPGGEAAYQLKNL
jgi:hypothetical protein